MKLFFSILLLVPFSQYLWGQEGLPKVTGDTSITQYRPHELKSPDYKKRQKLVAASSIAIYGGSLIALNKAWYSSYPKTSFHTFDDSREWLQMDKIGHAWSAYNLSRISTAAWKWAGLPQKKSVLIGSISGFTYLTVIELLDAHSEKWGWSWADMGANLAGSGLFAAQQLAWSEQRIQFKFSAHRKNYPQDLKARADDLFGPSLPERLLKDYNGQTYWFSFNTKSFLPNINLPAWLNIAVGYGAEGMLGGHENIAYNSDGNIIFNRPDIKRTRQWFIAPDIDLTKIKTNKKGVRTILSALNSIKIPAPTLEFTNGKLRGRLFYF